MLQFRAPPGQDRVLELLGLRVRSALLFPEVQNVFVYQPVLLGCVESRVSVERRQLLLVGHREQRLEPPERDVERARLAEFLSALVLPVELVLVDQFVRVQPRKYFVQVPPAAAPRKRLKNLLVDVEVLVEPGKLCVSA